MNLADVWFVIIAVFWTGFFVLEGFDFGVGALHRVIGRSESERRTAINTIAPFWDGNEVWLVVGAAAIFAAFPAWYATWLSALYLGIVLLLVALIARGVSLEWRGKGRSRAWRGGWSLALTAGSIVAPLVLGIALGDLLAGLPIDEDGAFTGRVWSIFTGFGVWTGLTLVALCLLHGATFLAIRTTDELRQRAVEMVRDAGRRRARHGRGVRGVDRAHGAARMAGVPAARGRAARDHRRVPRFPARKREGRVHGDGDRDRRDGRLAVREPVPRRARLEHQRATTASPSPAAASGDYALTVMTIVAAIFFPIVLLYQGYTYVVLRRRIGGAPTPVERIEEPRSPRVTGAE